MNDDDWKKLADAMFYTDQKSHRDLPYSSDEQEGWVRYLKEEWHFEYETDRWQRAQTAGVDDIV